LSKAIKILSVAACPTGGEIKKQSGWPRVLWHFLSQTEGSLRIPWLLEECKKRRPQKTGQGIGLVYFSQKVRARAFRLWLPKGSSFKGKFGNFLKKAQKKAALWKMVITPHIGQKELLCTSASLWKYWSRHAFQRIQDTKKKMKEFLVKTHDCPPSREIYIPSHLATGSYQNDSLNLALFYRMNKWRITWTDTGVRGSTQGWRPTFCTPDQLAGKFKNVHRPFTYMYWVLWFPVITAQVSVRDLEKLKKYIGSVDKIGKAETPIINAQKKKASFCPYRKSGEALSTRPEVGFHGEGPGGGPLGRNWQLGFTIFKCDIQTYRSADLITKQWQWVA